MTYQVVPASGKIAVSCNCRLSPPASGQVRDLLHEWMADHPLHTRKEHIFAYDLFKWLERRSSGGRE